MLKAGYLEDWEYNDTLSGAPQGGVVSPILSNIYLHKLDVFVETGSDPGVHPRNVAGEESRLPPGTEGARHGHVRAGTGPKRDHCVSGCAACRARTHTIPATAGCVTAATPTITCWGSPGRRPKPRRSSNGWRQFLRDELTLELSEEKTLITHARTSAARFLGYEITVQHNDKAITNGQRSSNGTVRLGCQSR